MKVKKIHTIGDINKSPELIFGLKLIKILQKELKNQSNWNLLDKDNNNSGISLLIKTV